LPRPYHSASSIALALRCQHAWAKRYIDGVREPEVTWADIEAGAEHTPRQRSTALGKAMHTVGETWYRGGSPAWDSLPGKVFLSGAHHLPHPTRVDEAIVEQAIGNVEIDGGPCQHDGCGRPRSEHPCGVPWHAYETDRPTRALDIGGVLWAGFIDLQARAPAELARLGIEDVADGWLLSDYKSSADVNRYALTPEGLWNDVQANLYVVHMGHARVPARWVYFETKKVRRSRPVDVRMHLDHALEVIAPCVALARELDTLERSSDAPKNSNACGDYNGCPHHVTRGGTCDARRSLGGLIQARVKKEPTHMAISPEKRAEFEARRKSLAEHAKAAGNVAVSAAPAEAPPAEVIDTPGEPVDETPAAAVDATPTQAKPRAGAKAKPAADVARLQKDLDAALGHLEVSKSRVFDALDALRAAVAG
jgi:hypothetical protein